MADLVITAANVVDNQAAFPANGVSVDKLHFANTHLTQGMAVYLDPTSVQWKKALGDSSTDSGFGSLNVGIVLNEAYAGQPVTVQTGGPITIGAAVVKGTIYFLSSAGAAGGVTADVPGAGKFVTKLGEAVSTTVINLDIDASGISV